MLHDCARDARRAERRRGAAFEGFRANLSPLDPRVHARAPGAGAGRRGRGALRSCSRAARSGNRAPRGACRIRCRSAASRRCTARRWRRCDGARRRSSSSSTARPTARSCSPTTARCCPTATSTCPALALALRRARPRAGAGARRSRSQRCHEAVMSPAFSDLPLQLTRHGPAHSGFATVQKTLTALYNEIRHRANPASLDFLPVSETRRGPRADGAERRRRRPADDRRALRYARGDRAPDRARRRSTCASSMPPRHSARGARSGCMRRCAAQVADARRRPAARTPTSRASLPNWSPAAATGTAASSWRDEVARCATGTRCWSRWASTSSSSRRRSASRSRSRYAARHLGGAQRPRLPRSARDQRLPLHDPDAGVSRAADPGRRPRQGQRDHLHGRVLADDPHPQRRDRHPRGPGRRRRRRRAAWA